MLETSFLRIYSRQFTSSVLEHAVYQNKKLKMCLLPMKRNLNMLIPY